MNRKQMVCLWLTVLTLIATWLFPPWIVPATAHLWGPRTEWAFLFDDSYGQGIDWERLVCLDLVVATLGAAVVLSLARFRGQGTARIARDSSCNADCGPEVCEPINAPEPDSMRTTSATRKSLGTKHPAEDFYRATRAERASRLEKMPALISLPSIARAKSASKKRR
jgi:hypothetical protein